MDKLHWDNLLLANNGSFLQSEEWGELQEKLGRQTKRIYESGFSALFIKNSLPFGKNYLYAPRGPVLVGGNTQLLANFIQAAKKAADPDTIFFRLEPELSNTTQRINEFRMAGFHRSAMIQPDETLILDLSQNEDALLKNMEHDTRYAIKAAQKRGVEIRRLINNSEKGEYFNSFWNIFKETNKKHHLKIYPQNYYHEVLLLDGTVSSELWLAYVDNQLIAAAIIVFFGQMATYLYASSASGYSRYNAPTLILWQAILAAKISGYKFFDFWGISNTNLKWAGVTAFKKSFGGREVDYIGAWDYPLNKKWYLVYQIARKLLH